MKKALWYFQRVDNNEVYEVLDYLPRLAVFKHSDVSMLNNFAASLINNGAGQAWDDLLNALERRIFSTHHKIFRPMDPTEIFSGRKL